MMRGHGMTIELGGGAGRGLCLPSLFCKTKPRHAAEVKRNRARSLLAGASCDCLETNKQRSHLFESVLPPRDYAYNSVSQISRVFFSVRFNSPPSRGARPGLRKVPLAFVASNFRCHCFLLYPSFILFLIIHVCGL